VTKLSEIVGSLGSVDRITRFSGFLKGENIGDSTFYEENPENLVILSTLSPGIDLCTVS
jgi:hypothetical protein